jgi:DNA-binding MarR family transcriptional regulator
MLQRLRQATIRRKDAVLSFQEEIVSLIRALGLHRPDTTPCGQPISVAEAQAVLELSRGGGISQNGLANRLRLEKSTVSRIASALEARGWLERDRDPHDSRLFRLHLTAMGKRIAGNLDASRKAKFAKVLAAIPVAKRAGVIEALSTLSEALRET